MDELVVASLDMHFEAGNETLTPPQWENHQAEGVCPACAEYTGMRLAIDARNLVMSS